MVRRKGRVVPVGDVGLELDRATLYPREADVLISTSYGPGRYDPIYEEAGVDYPLAYVRWTENRNMEEFLRLLAARTRRGRAADRARAARRACRRGIRGAALAAAAARRGAALPDAGRRASRAAETVKVAGDAPPSGVRRLAAGARRPDRARARSCARPTCRTCAPTEPRRSSPWRRAAGPSATDVARAVGGDAEAMTDWQAWSGTPTSTWS